MYSWCNILSTSLFSKIRVPPPHLSLCTSSGWPQFSPHSHVISIYTKPKAEKSQTRLLCSAEAQIDLKQWRAWQILFPPPKTETNQQRSPHLCSINDKFRCHSDFQTCYCSHWGLQNSFVYAHQPWNILWQPFCKKKSLLGDYTNSQGKRMKMEKLKNHTSI